MSVPPTQVLSALFRARFGDDPARVTPVAAQGSKRRMLRLTGRNGETAIGVLGPDRDENRAFLSFSKALRGADLPVPEILAEGEDGHHYLVEDLGDTTLFAFLEAERASHGDPFPDTVRRAYERVVEALPRLQLEGDRVVDYRDAHPRAVFDRRALKWDLDAFKYMFLRLGGIPFHEDRLEDDCAKLAEHLLEAGSDSFVFRDFQSRNVMLREDGSPWFIDYQGGRRGALQYDLASLLYDGKAALSPEVRTDLFNHYLDALAEHRTVDRARFRNHFGGYVLVRILQAMSAYGYLGFYLRKPHFLHSVPHAVRNLAHLLARERLLLALPELKGVFERIVEDPRWQVHGTHDDGVLTVHVGSFSYKHGYPADPSGHGGGYVFDCRAVPNPGREARFASLCGLDADVVSHLAESPDARAFHGNASNLVRAQVDTYRARGFTSLSVQFGCTGGQHRSVYFAQRLGAELAAAYPDVTVVVTHREADRWPVTAGHQIASIEATS